MGGTHSSPVLRRHLTWLLAGMFLVAFAVRLTAVLRGGGLYGFVGYDGSVYYTAAAGLAHGLLPYQDFLLLHPPGVVLALLPFAALGRLVGDADAFALARLTWIAVGGANAALVSLLLRRYGLWPAIAGGLFYTVYVPALYSERNTSLEAIGSLCLLVCVGLLTWTRSTAGVPRAAFLVAGLFLGASASIKIWGAALAVVLVLWSLATAGLRRALLLLGGVVGGAVLVCLPFFLAAPATMWRMVVLDQLGRRRVVSRGLTTRVVDIGGLSELQVGPGPKLLLVGLCVALFAVLVVLGIQTSLGRLALLLFTVTAVLLLLSPSWSARYAGLAAPPAALLFGSAVAALDQRFPRHRATAAVLVGAGLAGYAAINLPGLTFGQPFPAAALRQPLIATKGCITTDDPTVLIETGTLRTNLDAGCPLVADLGGYSYDLQPGARLQTSRAKNKQWQRFTLDYLGSGSATVIARFRSDPGFSRATKAVIATWPVLHRAGGYSVQQPRPPGGSPR